MTRLSDFDLLTLIKHGIQKLPRASVYGFLSLFIALNLIFLYHGAHLLFGDHDWRYLREPIELGAGLFEGRFSQFILINLLSQGEILPLINNLYGFFFYSLGIVCLARYWRIKATPLPTVLFCLIVGITPYLLSFMYFAFLIMPILSWNFVIIIGLILSEKEFSYLRCISAIALFALALGGYPPVINMIATVFCVRLLLAVLYEQIGFKNLCQKYYRTILYVLGGVISYKLIFAYLIKTGTVNGNYYNLQTIRADQILPKLVQTFHNIGLQFSATLPFITHGYKTLMFGIILTAAATILCFLLNKKNTFIQKLTCLILSFGAVISPLIVFFISTATAETEFSPRIDFFGLVYLYGGAVAFCLNSRFKINRNLCLIFGGLAVIVSSQNLYEAQKVWRLGFENELKLYKRIGNRFQQDELFNPYSRYIIVQDTDVRNIRKRYYHTPYKHPSDDLLDIPFVPGMNAGWMWDFYSGTPYADKTAYVYTFRPDDTAKTALRQAKPWPAPESTVVGPYWIMYFLSPDSTRTLQQRYLGN